jgi:predicted GNAT family acetyltransferase
MADPKSILMALARQQAQSLNQSPFSQAVNSDINRNVSAVASALMAPGNALRGEYNYNEIEPSGYVRPFNGGLMDAASNMAGVVSLGAAPLPRPVNSLSMGPMFRSAAQIEEFAKANGVSLALSESPSKLSVGKIVVPPSERNKGIGSQIMRAVTEYADTAGKPVTLTPSTDFGGRSVKSLEDFYKRFGFGSNQGRKRDYSFSDSMVRYPGGK